MGRARRGLLTALVSTIVLAGGAAPAVAAQSPTPAGCTGNPGPCVVITGSSDAAQAGLGKPVHFTFVATNEGGAVDRYSFDVDTQLQPDSSSAAVDGTKATIDKQGHIDGTASFVMTPGKPVTITFTAARTFGSPATAVTRVTADLGTRSNDVTTSALAVDLGIQDLDGGAVERGNPRTGIQLYVDVPNQGSDAVRPRLTFAVPSGWTVRPQPGFPTVTCRTVSGRATCDDSRLIPGLAADGNTNVDLLVIPPTRARGGTKFTAHVHVSPIGRTDQNPSDNDAAFPVIDEGIADLSATITTASQVVALHRTTSVRVTVTNHGPSPATDLSVNVSTNGTYSHRKVVLSHPHGVGSIDEGGAGGDTPPVQSWQPGTLASGRSVVLTLTLTGHAVGTARVILWTFETAGDPGATSLVGGLYETTRVQSRSIKIVTHLAAAAPTANPLRARLVHADRGDRRLPPRDEPRLGGAADRGGQQSHAGRPEPVRRSARHPLITPRTSWHTARTREPGRARMGCWRREHGL